MKKIYLRMLFVLSIMLATTALWAKDVTVTLVDENDTALANYPTSASEMSYKYRNPSWTYGSNLQTDGNGQFTVNITNESSWDGKITLTLNQVSKEMVVTAGAVTFQTAKVNVNLKNECTGLITDAPGGTLEQGGGHWYAHGTTSGTGVVSFYTFPGNVKLRMKYNWKSITQTPVAIVAGVNEVDFLTTNVNIIAGSVKYQTGGWPTVTFPIQLLQGSHNLKIDGTIKTIAVSGCSLTGGFLTLVDELGNAMANYPANYPTETRNLKYKYRCGGSWAAETSFQTDANGQTFYSIGCSNWDNKITMTLNQTTLQQDVTVNSVFQAAKVNVNLITCDGLITDAPGGTVAQGGGYWYTHGTTGTTGIVSLYTFPASRVKLRMNYNHGTQTLYPAITAGTNEVDFSTTAVTLVNSGAIKSNKGGSWWYFAQPTMNLLPGVYKFKFQSGSTWSPLIPLTVSGCSMSSLLANITLKNESGSGIAGGVVTYTPGVGNWSTLGTTDNKGNVFALIPTGTGGDTYKMTYKGQWMTKWHNMTTGDPLEFNTVLVTMKVLENGTEVAGTPAKYHGNAGGEWLFGTGTTTTSMEMLDIPYGIKFYVTYNGTKLTESFWKLSIDGHDVVFTVADSGTKSAQIAKAIIPVVEEFSFKTYPNPFSDRVKFEFASPEDTHARILMYDMTGRMVKTVFDNTVVGGVNYNAEFVPESQISGMYIYRMTLGEKVFNGKVVYKK